METLARINPVSYVIVGLGSLILEGWVVEDLPAGAVCFATWALVDRFWRPGLGQPAASATI
jgi:hypothetical protein